MNPVSQLDALIYTWTHGARGFVLAHDSNALFMVAGLMLGRVRAQLCLALPLLALPTLFVVGLSAEPFVLRL